MSKADAPGNVLTFANPVYDAADAKKVGTDNGFCVRTVKGKTVLTTGGKKRVLPRADLAQIAQGVNAS